MPSGWRSSCSRAVFSPSLVSAATNSWSAFGRWGRNKHPEVHELERAVPLENDGLGVVHHQVCGEEAIGEVRVSRKGQQGSAYRPGLPVATKLEMAPRRCLAKLAQRVVPNTACRDDQCVAAGQHRLDERRLARARGPGDVDERTLDHGCAY